MLKNAEVVTGEPLKTHKDGSSKILVCIWCGCPGIKFLTVPDPKGTESPLFVLTLVGMENTTGCAPGELCSLVLCHGPVFSGMFGH